MGRRYWRRGQGLSYRSSEEKNWRDQERQELKGELESTSRTTRNELKREPVPISPKKRNAKKTRQKPKKDRTWQENKAKDQKRDRN